MDFLSGFVRSSREALPKINKYFTAGKMGLVLNWAVYAGGRCNFFYLLFLLFNLEIRVIELKNHRQHHRNSETSAPKI